MHRKQSKPTRIDTLPTSEGRPTIGKLLQQVMVTGDGAGEGEGAQEISTHSTNHQQKHRSIF